MSWLSGYKSKPSTSSAGPSADDLREAKRKKLESERALRAQQRLQRQKELESIAQSKIEADKALQELLSIEPDLLAADNVSIADSEVDRLLSEETLDQEPEEAGKMADFDAEDGTDGKTALGEIKGVVCPFMKDDIEFWFGQLEGQLEVIEVKSQWLKRIALQRFLPADIQEEVKGLLSLGKTAAGNEIYFKIKKELVELFGRKPEDAYTRAKNRVLSGKPSQLGKALINDLCKKDKKLDGCCCGDIIWGMFREKLPIVVRNHIAEMSFNKDTYKAIFTKADQVWDSNQSSVPLMQGSISP